LRIGFATARHVGGERVSFYTLGEFNENDLSHEGARVTRGSRFKDWQKVARQARRAIVTLISARHEGALCVPHQEDTAKAVAKLTHDRYSGNQGKF
jgi:hypothetical protein